MATLAAASAHVPPRSVAWLEAVTSHLAEMVVESVARAVAVEVEYSAAACSTPSSPSLYVPPPNHDHPHHPPPH